MMSLSMHSRASKSIFLQSEFVTFAFELSLLTISQVWGPSFSGVSCSPQWQSFRIAGTSQTCFGHVA